MISTPVTHAGNGSVHIALVFESPYTHQAYGTLTPHNRSSGTRVSRKDFANDLCLTTMRTVHGQGQKRVCRSSATRAYWLKAAALTVLLAGFVSAGTNDVPLMCSPDADHQTSRLALRYLLAAYADRLDRAWLCVQCPGLTPLCMLG